MIRPILVPLLIAAASCSGEATQMLAYDYVGEGEHVLQAVPLGPVTDPVRMRTELGDVVRGARLTGALGGELSITPGGPVRLEHVVRDDTFVPLDEQGLVMASFFHHINAAAEDLRAEGHGAAADALLPVDAVMWGPTFFGDLGAAENAAFVSIEGFDGFVLVNDANNEVPLGAHAGVVRHELAHGYLRHYLDSYDPVEAQRLSQEGILSVFQARALNEGFADMLAVLTLDDADALPIAGRDPRGAYTVEDVVSGDPYSIGVILAALTWDARIATSDAPGTFSAVLEALKLWETRLLAGELEQDAVALAFAAVFVEVVLAEHPEVSVELCTAYEDRFDEEAPACS